MNNWSGRVLPVVFLVFSINMQLYSQNKSIYKDKTRSESERVSDLISKMTLVEKIGQMNQLNFDQIYKDLEEKIKKGSIGSLLNVTKAEEVNQLQQVALQQSRLGIPLIIGRDVIHGLHTIFPIPLGQAASFDDELVKNAAHIAAVESREKGINWTFAPMLDISRDARWGRIAESLGEDPYLAGRLGAAMVRGFQGNKLSDATSIAACLKHFAGYGAAEGGRDYNSTNIPIHLLRNVYLEPFRKSVEAGAATVMTSFNDNDGIPASGNSFLLKQVLRKEWNFDGFVVSDWASMSEMISHGFAADRKEVASLSANAGLDMEMVSQTYIQNLEQLVKEGKVPVQAIDELAKNILRIKIRMGLFENPFAPTGPGKTYSQVHLNAARESAVKSAVLLKNNNQLLPLDARKKIAVIGPMADAPHDQMGTWVFDGQKEYTVTPLKALQTEYQHINYVYEPALTFTRDKNKANFEKAVNAAKQADVVVAFLGEESILSGEAHSLSNINLVGAQSELLAALKAANKPVVLVIMAGRPLTIERDLPNADAVLYNFHPGTMGGPAIWDLLFGKANPSGKLPVTFVREVGQIPMYYNHNNTGRPGPKNPMKLDDIPLEAKQSSLGNSSFYLDSGRDPLFPFGYGLSYSSFEYKDLKLSATKIKPGEKMKVSATLTNTGKYEGTEVVQLYVQDIVGSITRPVKELKGYQKISLKPGETKLVTFELSSDDVAFYGLDLVKKAENGMFNVWVGGSSDSGLKGSFSLEQ